MSERLTQGEALVGALEVEDHATVKSLSVDTDAAIAGKITGVDAIDFDVSAVNAAAVARLKWNATDGSLDLGMLGGNVTLQIGEQQFIRVRHADNSGLDRGKVVYFVGSDGTNKTVRYASASVEATSVDILGVMAETVTGGNTGWCCTFGFLKNMNTNGMTEGKVAWLSASPGGITTTKPTAPSHGVQIGYVIRAQQNNGVIFVKVQNGYELDELHDVLITNPQEGDVLVYSASAGNIWRNQQP